MTRVYSKSAFESDTAALFEGGKKDDIYYTCPCCNSNTSNGDHAQAMYYSLIDDMYKILTDDNDFNRNKAATKLITRLNESINTSISRNGTESVEGGTAKIKRINLMIEKLLEVRK